MRGNLYIPSMDVKDLYLANNYIEENQTGYNLYKSDGKININKFINSFDYSLDLIELRKVAENIYPKRESLSFIVSNKEYSSKVINVTFKYSVKEYNQISKGFYVRYGYDPQKVALKDCIDIREINGKKVVIAIKCDIEFYNYEEIILPSCFELVEKEKGIYCYKKIKEPKTMKSAKELRKWAYENGFRCNGIEYCRFKRSSGSARVGKCLFIDKRLYPEMHKSEQCGLDIKEGQELDIAAFEAYIALPTSSIIDTIEIKPKNILVIDDYESIFKDTAVCTNLDANNWLVTSEEETTVSNSIWDGQSLLDSSLFEEKYKERGMMLLRNKFFKSCCFNTNIQQFFKDNHITDITQVKGRTIAKDIKDIKLITTPSSIKFFKFGEFNTWLDNIYPFYGIVKYDKNTHYFDGRLVQCHYQLLNTLQLDKEEVEEFARESLEYVSMLNTDPDIMRYHLKFKDTYEQDVDNIMLDKNQVVYKMLGFDNGFENTDLYHKFKENLCRAYIKNMKRGHILVDGTYATLFGNPYEMLLQSIGKFDGTSVLKVGTVHNIRYNYGEELLGSRSPHVTIGNILVTKNVECPVIDKYFNLSNNIICINSIKENILERLSGADFDSDTVLITNNEILLNAAKRNYGLFNVPTRKINPPKSKRKYSSSDLSDLDDKTSNNKIGEIVNLSQELNSLLWDIVSKSQQSVEVQYDIIKEIYYDVCQLDVMSNIEIDKAKKEYPVDMQKELNKIRDKYKSILTNEEGRKYMPAFLGFIAELKDYKNDDRKKYKHYNTSMDYLLKAIEGKRSSHSSKNFKKLSDIFKPKDFNDDKINYQQINKILNMAQKTLQYHKVLYAEKNYSSEEIKELKKRSTEDLLRKLNELKITSHTMYRLLYQLEREKDMSLRNYLFYVLFNYHNQTLTDMLYQYPQTKNVLREDINGSINIYGKFYKKFGILL